MSGIDLPRFKELLAESFRQLEAQANDPALPPAVRKRAAAALRRRERVVAKYPQFFGVSNSETDTNRHAGENRGK